MVRKKDIVVSVLLSIFTCGIYTLYWTATITNDVADILRDSRYRTGGTVVLLTIFTCGIYRIYWTYVTSRDIYYAEQDLGMRTSDNTVLNVILGIFTATIIPMVIMQKSINDISDELYNA
ncbi:DUF4234 domain-containing protein [Breznakia pachnodae]|uniref:Phenolic acid decarboxylase n=1 Tax=Breznakia pachnodae TaxID=265178 RepID=A0ABU0E383_9FIRM|nr:DUF4234 domain-containing protein [Breznakia pachnodae]MDQ0361345.1 phenolic acid decarboxylase [Breznakia pachnodae]